MQNVIYEVSQIQGYSSYSMHKIITSRLCADILVLKVITFSNYVYQVSCSLLETFSIRFFMGNCKPQTEKCHVSTALRSRLQFAVHV